MVLALLIASACMTKAESMSQSELTDFATRHAAAWSGQNPEDLASFYAEDGSLTVNAGGPSVGRAAIASMAGQFMEAFPDMVVKMESVSREQPGDVSLDVDRNEHRPWRYRQARSNQRI